MVGVGVVVGVALTVGDGLGVGEFVMVGGSDGVWDGIEVGIGVRLATWLLLS